MTLILQRPTGSKLTLRQTWQPMDPDAAAYITAVETADGQALEEKVKIAIDNFVLGCKADGIWSAIKASCILAGARTLNGALVPLVGAAPTNFNFVSGDYDRETGLVGDGSTKYLDSNLAYNSIPSDNEHLAVFRSTALSNANNAIGGGSVSPTSFSRIGYFSGSMRYDSQEGIGDLTFGSASNTGFVGINRSTSSDFVYRDDSITNTVNRTSSVRANTTTGYGVFAGNYFSLTGASPTSARLSFYSIGESLDLALLDARVTDLINAIGVAIP